MKRLKSGNVLVCEYIAPSAHGKHTLVNVYSGDIIVSSFPAVIPLAFYIELFLDAATSTSMKFQVLQGREIKAEVQGEFEFEAGKMGIVVLPAFMFHLPSQTEVKIIASGQGFQTTTLVRKKIRMGVIPA